MSWTTEWRKGTAARWSPPHREWMLSGGIPGDFFKPNIFAEGIASQAAMDLCPCPGCTPPLAQWLLGMYTSTDDGWHVSSSLGTAQYTPEKAGEDHWGEMSGFPFLTCCLSYLTSNMQRKGKEGNFISLPFPSESQGDGAYHQQSLCERRCTPWTGHKSITGSHRDNWDTQPFTLSLT